MLLFRSITIILVLGLCSVFAFAQDNFTKLAPEPTVILIESGSGSVKVIFARNAGIATPEVKVTEAAGPTNSISEKDITFRWLEPPPVSNKRELLMGQISVTTQTFVEAGATYKGNLILLWPDAEPKTVSFSIQNPSPVSFDLAPEKIDVSMATFEPGDLKLRIRNTGKSKITNFIISGAEMKDATTGHRLELRRKDVTLTLAPGQETEADYPLPQPTLAGTYSGSLDVTANQTTRKSLPLVIRSRGPNYRGLLFLPFLFFVLVLVFTFWLSTALEDWFGHGGLQRAQAILSLQKAQTDLNAGIRRLVAWEKTHSPALVPRTKARLEGLADEVTASIQNSSTSSLTDLTNDAQRFATETAANNIFWTVLQLATKKFDDLAKLSKVAGGLDNVVVPQPLDLNVYRDNLRKVLLAAISAEGLGGEAAAELSDTTNLSPQNLQAKINSMARLYRVLVWIVVFVTAYQTLYFNNKSFGTFLDYIAVFLWTLGLTQTGTQILGKAHSSYNRSTS